MTLSTENKNIKERDYWLDNVKGILIILVVVAHCIGTIFYNSLVIRQIYYFINLFHMPAFIMISGYFAKRKIDEKDYAGVFKRLLIPYVLYYCVGIIIQGFTGDTMTFNLLEPTYGMWYILVLGIFMLITPALIDKFGKHMMWISVVIMICAYAFNLAINGQLFRVLTYYPFFLIGYFLQKDTLEKFNKSKVVIVLSKILALLFFVGVFLLILKVSDLDLREVFWRGYNIYEQMEEIDVSTNRLIALNVGAFILGILCSFGVILIAPRKKTFLSHLGQYSLYIFVLHLQAVLIMKYFYNLYRLPYAEDVTVDAILLIAFAIIMCFLFASKPVRKITRPFVEPKVNLSFVRKLIDGDNKNG